MKNALRERAYLSQLTWSCPQSHGTLLCFLYLPRFQELSAHEKTELEYMTGQANTHWSRNVGLSGSATDTQQQVCGEELGRQKAAWRPSDLSKTVVRMKLLIASKDPGPISKGKFRSLKMCSWPPEWDTSLGMSGQGVCLWVLFPRASERNEHKYAQNKIFFFVLFIVLGMSSSNSRRWQSSLKTDRETLFPLLKFTVSAPVTCAHVIPLPAFTFVQLSFAVVVSTFLTYHESTTILLCLLHPWESCFQIRSSLQVPGGCGPPVFNSLPCRVCICLPSHPQCKALTKFLIPPGPMEKRWGRRANERMSTLVKEGLQRFSRLAGRFHLPSPLPSASGFSKNMV